MPVIYYDKDGNEVSMPGTPEEIIQKFTEYDTLKTQNQEIGEKLKGLENKDFNWKKLKDMNDEEKAKLSATEMKLKESQEKVEEQQNSFQKTLEDNWKDKSLYRLVGSDPDLKVKVMKAYDSLNMEVKGEMEIAEKMSKAYLLATGSQPRIDPISATFGDMGGLPPIKPPSTGGEITSEVKELGSKMGLKDEDFKKAGFNT